MSSFVRNGVVPFTTGMLFATGLVIGGMTQPSKVVGFLDFFGDWDPSLAFVMGGAVLVYLPLYFLTIGKRIPFVAPTLALPTMREVDPRLVGGAALFGIGWGLGGYCPGPGIVSLTSGAMRAFAFVGAMVIGMWVMQGIDRMRLERSIRSAGSKSVRGGAHAASR